MEQFVPNTCTFDLDSDVCEAFNRFAECICGETDNQILLMNH